MLLAIVPVDYSKPKESKLPMKFGNMRAHARPIFQDIFQFIFLAQYLLIVL